MAQVDLGDRAETDDRIFPLFGIGFPEGEDVADLARVVAVFSHQPDGFLGRDVLIEVEKLPLPLAHLIGRHRESLLGEIAVATAVVAARDMIGEREVGVDGHELIAIVFSLGFCARWNHLLTRRHWTLVIFTTAFDQLTLK